MKFKSQICTSVEQSQHLLDLGLKPETADMEIEIFKGDNSISGYVSKGYWETDISEELTELIPAWSLHRLKCLLPTKIPYESGYLTTEIINNVNLMFITDTSEQRVISFIHENLYESMIKCIEWLIKEDYFNKEYLKQ